MELQSFIKLVKKRFGFLIENENSIVYKESEPNQGWNCFVVRHIGYKIKFIDDETHVEIGGGPIEGRNDSLTDWYRLITIISLVTRGPKQINLEYTHKWVDNEETTVDNQLIQLAQILNPYWGMISDFFQQEGFEERRKEYEEYRERQMEKRWPSYAKSKQTQK